MLHCPLLCCRFKLDCEEAPVDPDDDDSDYGYGGGYGSSYDRGYDRSYGGGGGYKHHNRNHTYSPKRHDYEEYGGYRRRLQAGAIVEDIGECLLTGISPVGISLDLDATKAAYTAQVSGKW
jgi:hypothetical protein